MKEKHMNKACFICHTPYHIIQAIILSKYIKYNDIFVCSDYTAAKDIIIYLPKINRFEKIGLIDFKHSTCKSSIDAWKQTIQSYLFANKQGRLFGWQNFEYDLIIFPSNTVIQSAVFTTIKKKLSKNQIRLYTFDDGAFSYYKNSASFISNKNQIVRFLFFGKLGLRKQIIHLLYQPQICSIEDKYIKKVKLPSLTKDDDLRLCLNMAFNLSEEIKLENKILVFAGLWQEIYGDDGANYLKNILFQIANKINYDLVIKKHPRDNTNFFNEFKLWGYNGIPAELLFLNIPDLENKILITDASTACITPKMLFNQEVKVIMLYKLLEQYKPISKEMNDFFIRIKKSYQLQEHFFIPETIEELWAFFDCLS